MYNLMQKYLLPGNSSRFASDLLLALRVGPLFPGRGRNLVDAGLRNLYGITIQGIVRKGVWTDLK